VGKVNSCCLAIQSGLQVCVCRAGEVIAASERCCGNRWPMNGNTSVCCARSGPVRPTGNATRCCEDRRGRYRALYDHTKQVSFVTCHSPPTRLRSRFLPSPPPLPFPPVLPSLPSLRSRPLKSSYGQRRPGRSPSRNRIWCILALKYHIWWQ